jgi:hypothetical protein
VQQALRGKRQTLSFTLALIPLPLTGTQELVSKSDGQVPVDDHADIRTTTNEILKISPK